MSSGKHTGQAGFALVEVLVSAVLLVVLALAILPVVEVSGSRAATNRSRGVATSLAKNELERLRGLDVSKSLSNYRGTSTKTVDKTTYTLTSRADYVRDASGTVSCTTDSSAVDYLKLSTSVTWPRMNGTAPVTSDSLISPPVGTFGTNNGTLVVQLNRADGSPAKNIGVTAAGVGDVTNSLGCAVFGNVAAGTTGITINQSGYVGTDGVQAINRPATVSGGQTSLTTLLYDLAGAVPVSFDTLEARPSPLPTGVPAGATRAATASSVTASHQSLAAPRVFLTSPADTQQASITAASLFPFQTGYGIYAGQCAGNDPTAYDSQYYTKWPAAISVVPPGLAAPAVTVRVPDITVLVGRDNQPSTTLNDVPVVIRPNKAFTNMAACNDVYRARTKLLGGTTYGADIPVPFGNWTVCVNDSQGRKQTQDVANTSRNGQLATVLTRTGAPVNDPCP